MMTEEELSSLVQVLQREVTSLRRELDRVRREHTREIHIMRAAWTETVCERQREIMNLRLQVADLEHALNSTTIE